MTRPFLLTVLSITACATTDDRALSVDAIVICDHQDCAWIVSEGGIAPVAARGELELRVHSEDGGLAGAAWVIEQAGARIEVGAIDEATNPAGSDVTLIVPELQPGPVTLEARRGDATASFECTATGDVAEYGSTYSSSCTCSYCSMWCSTKKGVVYSGACC